MITVEPGTATPLTLTILARCRRCDACRRYRARLWTARAIAETRASARTWFGTLTLSPAERFRLLGQVRTSLKGGGEDFDRLAPLEQFRRYADAAQRDITLWLKRVRKESGAKLRYLAVTEEHVSGDPHWHVLVHEPHALTPVRKSVLQSQWRLGFSRWKLCDSGSAGYACKYLAKTLLARVRASQRYGQTSLDIVKETLRFLERETLTPPSVLGVGVPQSEED